MYVNRWGANAVIDAAKIEHTIARTVAAERESRNLANNERSAYLASN